MAPLGLLVHAGNFRFDMIVFKKFKALEGIFCPRCVDSMLWEADSATWQPFCVRLKALGGRFLLREAEICLPEPGRKNVTERDVNVLLGVNLLLDPTTNL